MGKKRLARSEALQEVLNSYYFQWGKQVDHKVVNEVKKEIKYWKRKEEREDAERKRLCAADVSRAILEEQSCEDVC